MCMVLLAAAVGCFQSAMAGTLSQIVYVCLLFAAVGLLAGTLAEFTKSALQMKGHGMSWSIYVNFGMNVLALCLFFAFEFPMYLDLAKAAYAAANASPSLPPSAPPVPSPSPLI